jgi:dynein heavy chain
MIAKSSEMPDTTEDLVELSKYVDECRYSTLSEMKALLRTVGDYIMFLFEYTEFKGKF